MFDPVALTLNLQKEEEEKEEKNSLFLSPLSGGRQVD